MNNQVVVIRYAEAFITYARKEIGLAQALSDLSIVRGLIRDNPELKDFLEATDITAYEKTELIDKVLEKAISSVTLNFIKLLLDKKRIGLFSEIAEYLRLTYAHEGEEAVVLRTGGVLDLDLVQRLENQLMKKYSKKFKFYIDLDDTLIAGVQVFIGNTVIDGSVRKKLTDLKEKLRRAEVR